MFNLNGSKNYSEIDKYTNSFSIYHNYGKVFSSSNTITVKRGETSFHVRPAAIIFKNNEVKISFGSYVFNDSDIIFYSFMFYKFEQAPRISESDIQARLTIISVSQINGSMRVIGICPNSVYVDADIPFNSIQGNKNPVFNIYEPENNGMNVVGYYYALNQTKNYFVTRNDKFISSFALNESNSQSLFPGNFNFAQSQGIDLFMKNNPLDETYIRLSKVMVNESFSKSGTWYFHVRAINSITNMSRMTATYSCIYNSAPSIPLDLRTNTDVSYEGPLSHHSMSFIQSESEDDDTIQYVYELYKNEELIKQETFYPTRYDDRLATIEANIEIVRNNFQAKMTIDGRTDTEYSSAVIASVETYIYSEELPYEDIPCLNCKLEIYRDNEESNSSNIDEFNKYDERLVYFYDNINEIGYGDGIFKWRVKALDWLQQSSFSDFCNYTISTIKEVLGAKLNIPIYAIEQGFKAKLNILSNSIVKGMLYIYPILNAKLYIAKHSDQETYPEPGSLDYRLACKMFIRPHSELYCKMRIVNNFSTFSGKLVITDVKGNSDLNSKLIVIKPGDDGIRSKLTISLLSGSSFSSKMLMCLKELSSLNCKVEIQNVGFSCKATILRNTSTRDDFNASQFDSYYLSGRMTCINKPNKPIITSSAGNEWQDNNNISLSWFSPPANIQVVSYGYLLSRTRLSNFNIGNFLNTTLLSSDFNLNDYGGVGEYYFYVFARASNGSISDVSEYRIRYNIKPQTPGSIMLINGNECIINRPLISARASNSFEWNRIFAEDGDLLYYDFEISDNIGFNNIVYSDYNIFDNSNTETLEIEVFHEYEYKTHYWRVRSFDGKEYSNWSLIGQFIVNTPPSAPTNLRIG